MALRHQEETSKGIGAIQEFVVQYSQELRPIVKAKSLLLSYDSCMFLEGGDTTDLSFLGSHQEKKSYEYPRSTRTMIVTHQTMALPNDSSAILEKLTDSANNSKQKVIVHTFSRTTSWKTDGETPFLSFRVNSSSSKVAMTHELNSQETITTRIGILFYPEKWMNCLGVNLGIRMSATVDNG